MKTLFILIALIFSCSIVQAKAYYPDHFALLELEGVQLFANMKEPEEYFIFYQGKFFKVIIKDKSRKADFLNKETSKSRQAFYDIEAGEPKPLIDEPDDIPYMKFAKSTKCQFD